MKHALPFTLLTLALAAPGGAEEFFTDRIAPLLKQRCFECHSHESGKMKGGLTLDSKPGWAEGGEHGPAILPGAPENSLLVKMVRWTDADHQMPPKDKLPDEEIALLEEWIKRGAPDPRAALVKPPPDADWWSLRPLAAPAVPGAPDLSLTHPIDRFIRARLAGAALSPAPAADARTLIRRVTLDLTGLPPTPAETEAFAKESAASPLGQDGSSPAWLAVVDRLLASPRYGERWARHWLDTIHFADTHGFEHDVHRPNAWRFRDYVIGAFNQDTPWPRFIQEQLAADTLFPADTRLTAALGFLGAGPFDASAEGTAPAAYEYVDRDDLVTQTMGAFVSTTANCARCHAHKFDPITQDDYFSLQAVFAGVGKGNVAYDEDPATTVQRRQWTTVLEASDTIGPLQPEVLLTAENETLVTQWEAAGGGREIWQTLSPDLYTPAINSVLTRLADGSVLSSGPRPDTETYTLTVSSPPREVSALRIDLLTDDSLPLKGPGRLDNGNLHLSGFEAWIFRAGGAAPEKVGFTRALSDFDQAGYAAPTLIDGDPKTSWAIHPRVGEPHHAILKPAAPLTFAEGDRLVIALQQLQGGQHLLGRFRLSATAAPAETLIAVPAAAQAALLTAREQRLPEDRLALAAAVLQERAREELSRLPAQVLVYAASAANQAARGAILKAPQPRTIHILKRGDLDKPGAEAGPGALSAVAALNARFSPADPQNEGQRRAGLAGWIAHRDNPLTWRSAVNRVWHYHFGRGLCDTPSDFGRMGGVPSHPELLDWLAVWFRDEAKGSLKALHRLIVTSATWQQSSALPPPPASAAQPVTTLAPHRGGPDPQGIDPDNRLLWRMNRTRLDADSYRDAVMAASGRLNLTMGGPGIAHYNASPGPQATPVLDYAGFDWEAPAAPRRSIYRVVYRGIADPFMEVLDFPDMGLLSPTRGFSASALQSLTLFNNPFLLGQSTHLAARVAGTAPAPAEPIRQMFQLVLLRDPGAGELEEFTALAQSAGLPAVARVLFNTNEFLFID
jgi:hypothetical protein